MPFTIGVRTYIFHIHLLNGSFVRVGGNPCGSLPDHTLAGAMLASGLRSVIGNSGGWLAAGSRLVQGLTAPAGAARHASSHAENTNTFLREVRTIASISMHHLRAIGRRWARVRPTTPRYAAAAATSAHHVASALLRNDFPWRRRLALTQPRAAHAIAAHWGG